MTLKIESRNSKEDTVPEIMLVACIVFLDSISTDELLL